MTSGSRSSVGRRRACLASRRKQARARGRLAGRPRFPANFGVMMVSLRATAVVLCMTLAGSGQAQKAGITHAALLKSALPGTANQEVVVWDTEYAAGAANPRHMHPAAITFHVLSGTGIWQEEGKAPVTLHAGDSLLVPAGTVHSHWNPSMTEGLRFLEFTVAAKDEGGSVPRR